MDRSDIAFMSAAELASAIEPRQLSPVGAVEAYLDRIERIDPKVNSYITVCADDARRDAERAEAEIQRGEYRGPLHGIPMAVKDQIHTKGIRTTDGSKIGADFVPGIRRLASLLPHRTSTLSSEDDNFGSYRISPFPFRGKVRPFLSLAEGMRSVPRPSTSCGVST